VLQKILIIKFYKNTSCGSLVIPCRWTGRRADGYDGANSHFSEVSRRKVNQLIINYFCRLCSMETPTSAAQQGEHCVPTHYTVF